MKTNVGSFDATARFLLGWSILFMGIHGLGWWALLGFVPILTSAFSYCPLYALLRIDTMAWEEAFAARHGKYPASSDRVRPGRSDLNDDGRGERRTG